MNELALFAGAGGGILGAKLLGWRTVCAVELEPFRADRLAQRQNDLFLPPFPIWNGDIADFDGRPWRGHIDVVSGGFPCQDISAANPKAVGITGARSGLWKQMARIIRDVAPACVFVENSPMLISRGLGTVLGDLAEMGFDAVWGVLGADDLGGFHRRDRIYILAYTPGLRMPSGCSDQARRSERITRELDHSGADEVGHACGDRFQERFCDSGVLRAQLPSIAGTSAGSLADSHQEHGRPEYEQQISSGGRPWEQPSGCGNELADRSGIGRRESLPQSAREQGRPETPECGHAFSYTDSRGSERQPENSGARQERRIAPGRSGGDALWSDREFILCRDGKIRATKPGLCGVAHGVADRVDRISAIGDGQVPAVVAAMVQILASLTETKTCS